MVLLDSRLLVLLLLLAVSLASIGRADACKCRPPDLPTLYKDVSNVMRVKILSGSVTKDLKGGFGKIRVYAAVVLQPYKGSTRRGDLIILKSQTSSASCGTKLKSKQMLVTAFSDEESPGNFVVDSCGYNKNWWKVMRNPRDKQFLDTRPACCEDNKTNNQVCDASKCGCVNGTKPVNCYADPCQVSSGCEEGTCTANYCGGCNAEWTTDTGSTVCTECDDDGDCNENTQKCVNKQCRTLCYNSDTCSDGHYCDEDQGICVRFKPNEFMYYPTCGYPVCRYPSEPIEGIPTCPKDIVEGKQCSEKDEGKECDPGFGCGVRLRCADSDPTNGGVCPKSRRATKRDVHYLNETSLAAISVDLLNIRLAEWNYKQDPETMDPRLGFIIEDVEPSPAVDSERDMVNMYGYLSMAVATLQTQQDQINKLQSIVDGLLKDREMGEGHCTNS